MAPRNSAFCLVSHKCNPRNHEVCREIGILLRQNDVEPLIDPFGPGDVVDSRIETLDFHTVLFLFCNESLESRACRYELDCAQRRLTPIFVVRLTQDVLPNALSGRIYVNLSSAEGLTFEREMKALARAIRERGRLYARIVSLGSENFPEVARETAKDVGTKRSAKRARKKRLLSCDSSLNPNPTHTLRKG